MSTERPWSPPSFDVDAWKRGVVSRPPVSTHCDALLAVLADLQHGTVERAQLLFVGMRVGQIKARLRSGHLHVIAGRPGVYAVGRAALGPAGLRMAAVLAAGRGARLAGWSGCVNRALLPQAGTRVDIAIPSGRRVALPGLTVLRTDPLPGEVTIHDGIPTHSVGRLLLDLARRDDDGEVLEWAWRQAIYTKQLDLRDVSRVLRTHHGRPGTPALRGLYQRRRLLAGDLRNRFEVLMLGILREAGLPEPLCNAPWEVAPGLILKPDFRIPELRLAIESDGRDGHEDVEFLLTDDERDALYAANGHTTERFTYWQAKRERHRVIAVLRRHLADPGSAPGGGSGSS